jgi:L-amino acid N-acyltransferase YncA
VRFLIDTNVLISSEPSRQADVEAVTAPSLELARLASGEHHLLVHPTVSDEIAHDTDVDRRRLRELVTGRYPVLGYPPAIQPLVTDVLGVVSPGTHDWYDHLLLAAVVADAVHGLITQDDGIHRKAARLGIADRVHTVADAVEMLSRLGAQPTAFVPSVSCRPMHALDLSDSFFDSLKGDYPGFDRWFREAARNGREAFVVDGPDGRIAGICMLKGVDHEIGLGDSPAKVSTLKVADEFKGSRYGELLLKVLFRSVAGVHDLLWLTVFDRHEELIALLETFGFRHHDDVGGEGRYVKRLVPTDEESRTLPALDFHVTFGPPAVRLVQGQTFVVPILPGYHSSLFPDGPNEQMSLLLPRPHGNALRKAYLSHANLRAAAPGATLLFYRSHDHCAVTAVGVLEESLVSTDADEILEFVGSRTVYSAEEVREMTAAGSVLTYLFRQDRFLDPPIDVAEMIAAGAIKRAPQTTIRIHEEASPWLAQRLDE